MQVPDPPKAVRPTRATPAKKRPQVDQAQKRREEIAALQEQVSGLQRELLEKEEALRSAENLISRTSSANEAVDGLRSQLSEKELLIQSAGSELHGTKVNYNLFNFSFALRSFNILLPLELFHSRKHLPNYCIIVFIISRRLFSTLLYSFNIFTLSYFNTLMGQIQQL